MEWKNIMADSKQKEFKELTPLQQIHAVNDRIGLTESNDSTETYPAGRIQTPQDLLSLVGTTICLVISPISKNANVGNCLFLEWLVGAVVDIDEKPLTEESGFNTDDGQIILLKDTDKNDYISIKDFNIIPNAYNNHAAFIDRDSANSYALYRKMKFEVDDQIAEIVDNSYRYRISGDDIEKFQKADEENS